LQADIHRRYALDPWIRQWRSKRQQKSPWFAMPMPACSAWKRTKRHSTSWRICRCDQASLLDVLPSRAASGDGAAGAFDFPGAARGATTRYGAFLVLRLAVKKQLRVTLRNVLMRRQHEPKQVAVRWLHHIRQRDCNYNKALDS
jgi:hypothetical protein